MVSQDGGDGLVEWSDIEVDGDHFSGGEVDWQARRLRYNVV